jgi:hypothetical protein
MSLRSREYFEGLAEHKSARFEIVRSASAEINSSLFVAVRPKYGSKWRHNMTLFWEELRDRGVDLTVVPEEAPHFVSAEAKRPAGEEKKYLLRVSFPYFLVGKSVRKLARHLNELLEKAN